MKLKFSTKEKKCRLCFSKKIEKILDLGNQPLANNLVKEKNIKQKKFPLKIFFCKVCKAVQLSETVNPNILFKKYFWTTSTSSTAKKFSIKFYKEIIDLKNNEKPLVVEIASNDGTFLVPFQNKGYEVIGVDPAKNISKIANKKKIPTINSFFDLKTSNIIKNNYRKADIIFARNVIAHVKNIHELIKASSNLISKNGIFAVEFHYAKKILDDLQYDSIYHEHLYYYSIKSLNNLFKKHSFKLFDAFESPISGGALVLIFSKEIKKKTKRLQKLEKVEMNSKVNTLNKWKKFSKEVQDHSNKFKKEIERMNNKYGKIVAYGASARSSTILNYARLGNNQLEFIADKNPLKNNLFTPGTKIKIVNSKRFLQKLRNYKIILLLAWNFKDEILKDLKKNRFKGKVILPLPKKIITKSL